jgi:hypothetical protein
MDFEELINRSDPIVELFFKKLNLNVKGLDDTEGFIVFTSAIVTIMSHVIGQLYDEDQYDDVLKDILARVKVGAITLRGSKNDTIN